MPTNTHKMRRAARHSCKQFNISESNNAVQRRQPNHLEAFKATLYTQLIGRGRWVRMVAKLREYDDNSSAQDPDMR